MALSDVFLSHNWGLDELGRDNHARVSNINEELRKLGYRTWFDKEQIKDEIFNQSTVGIQETQCVIFFITKKYYEEVIVEHTNDFKTRVKTSKLLAVIMEKGMMNINQCTGAVDKFLGGRKFVDMSEEFYDQTYFHQQMRSLQEELLSLGIRPYDAILHGGIYENPQQSTGTLLFILSGSALAELAALTI